MSVRLTQRFSSGLRAGWNVTRTHLKLFALHAQHLIHVVHFAQHAGGEFALAVLDHFSDEGGPNGLAVCIKLNSTRGHFQLELGQGLTVLRLATGEVPLDLIQGIERDQRGKWPRRIQGTLDSMMGSDRLDHSLSTLVICEGETDYLSLVEAGVKNALSVPHGAVNPGTEDGGAKLAFLSNDFDLFKGKTRVILALDGDAPGDAMAELLARRIGKARCYRVAYPDGYKD
ncbi:MAG: toprim domain-containing protein, partial [Betaproteobacteria bacterium]|nr:toprim domain-containing protein [Betaproteobacteria bacterium]